MTRAAPRSAVPPTLFRPMAFEREQRLAHLGGNASDASWSIGMGLFGFAVAFAALAFHSDFRPYRSYLVEASSIETFWGRRFRLVTSVGERSVVVGFEERGAWMAADRVLPSFTTPTGADSARLHGR